MIEFNMCDWRKCRTLEMLLGIGVRPSNSFSLSFSQKSGERCLNNIPAVLSGVAASEIGARYFRITSSTLLQELQKRDYCKFDEIPPDLIMSAPIRSVGVFLTTRRIGFQDCELIDDAGPIAVFGGVGPETWINLEDIDFDVTAIGLEVRANPDAVQGRKGDPLPWIFEVPNEPVMLAVELYVAKFGTLDRSSAAGKTYSEIEEKWRARKKGS